MNYTKAPEFRDACLHVAYRIRIKSLEDEIKRIKDRKPCVHKRLRAEITRYYNGSPPNISYLDCNCVNI